MARWNGHSKYGAKATTIDGHRFHSKKEADTYILLRHLEKVGEILDLELQPRFQLHANGKMIGSYIADFRYVVTSTGEKVVQDVKGFKTDLYKWKKKHVEAEYNLKILET
jgi:hypothetical protein